MLKNKEKTISKFMMIFDCVIVFAIWYFVYFIRFNFFKDAQLGLESDFLIYGIYLSILSVLMFNFYGLYNSQRLNKQINEILNFVWVQVQIFLIYVVSLYFFGQVRISRSVILFYFLISTVVFIIWKILLRKIMGELRDRGYNLRHFVLVGYNDSLVSFIKELKYNRFSGLKISKWYLPEAFKSEAQKLIENEKIENFDLLELDKFISTKKPDSIILAENVVRKLDLHEILSKIHNSVVPIYIFPDLSLSIIGSTVDSIAGIPTLKLNQPAFSELKLFIKRSLDIVGSIFGILLFSPVLLVTALLVKTTSKGPILFLQDRVGLDGQVFKIYKFRSMKIDAEKHASWTTADDPRKTKFGSFIRATSIDELPQFFNVLFGDMSLVGPRPEQPQFVDKFKNEIPAYMLRHKMKAGITGWAQVNGWRGDTSLHKRIECDLFYIRNWSISLDIKILFLTFWKGFINKNAY